MLEAYRLKVIIESKEKSTFWWPSIRYYSIILRYYSNHNYPTKIYYFIL